MKAGTMRKVGLAAVAMAVCLMWAGTARAIPESLGTITLKCDIPRVAATDGTAYIWSNSTGTEYVCTGVYYLTVTTSAASGLGVALSSPASVVNPYDIDAYCIDIHQDAPPSFALYNIYHLSDAPLWITTGGGQGAVMGAGKAADLGRLFALVKDPIRDVNMTLAANQTAFQACVWEIVNETSGTYKLGSASQDPNGTFRSWDGSLNVGLANGWLSSLGQYAANRDVIALVNTNTQDYALVDAGSGGNWGAPPPVPEPLTMAGLMIGIGGVVTYVRRRTKK